LCEPVVKAFDVAEVVGKPLRELVDRKGDVGAECLHGTFNASPGPVPNFALPLLRANEEDDAMFLVLIGQHEQALGLLEPSQIVEVAILPVGVLDIAVAHGEWGRRKNRDAISDCV
jgi:hypothetical protein